MWLLPFLTHVEKLSRQLFFAHCSLNNGNDNVFFSREQEENKREREREMLRGEKEQKKFRYKNWLSHFFYSVFAVQAISNSISCPLYSQWSLNKYSILVYKVRFKTYALPFSWMVAKNKCHSISHSIRKMGFASKHSLFYTVYSYTHAINIFIPFNKATKPTSLPASIHWLVWCNLYYFEKKKRKTWSGDQRYTV